MAGKDRSFNKARSSVWLYIGTAGLNSEVLYAFETRHKLIVDYEHLWQLLI